MHFPKLALATAASAASKPLLGSRMIFDERKMSIDESHPVSQLISQLLNFFMSPVTERS